MAHTYILQCNDGSFYVGSTTHLETRLAEHQKGNCRHTGNHLPVKLVYTEEYATESEAYKREKQLHGWSHAKKEALIKGDIETLKQLSKKK